MDLEFSADWTTIQKKFKTLVKKFHPDKHSGNKQYEDKVKKNNLGLQPFKNDNDDKVIIMTNLAELAPDIKISINQIFGIDTDMKVDGFSKKNEFVPEIDSSYKFDRDTTLAIISGFAFNKRVLIQGYHGTGKSTH